MDVSDSAICGSGREDVSACARVAVDNHFCVGKILVVVILGLLQIARFNMLTLQLYLDCMNTRRKNRNIMLCRDVPN